MSYWYLPEDDLYGALGVEPMAEDVELHHVNGLPEEYHDDSDLKQLLFDILSDHLGKLEDALEEVLDAARQAAKRIVDQYLREHGVDSEDVYDVWYKNMLDDFAHETYFGLLGGDPEYNEIHLTYLPAMFKWLEMEEDPEFFSKVAEAAMDAGNEAWEDWAKPTIVEAWDDAKSAVLEAAGVSA